MIDPAIDGVLRASLALLLAAAARHKLGDFAGFTATLRNYQLLPAAAPALAGAFAATEVLLAGCLLLPMTARLAGLGAAVLLSVYGAAIAINLLRGRHDIDCGCLGPAADRAAGQLSWALLARNGVLVAAAVGVWLPPTGRALVPLDALTIGAATLAVGLLWNGATALASAPRATPLRSEVP